MHMWRAASCIHPSLACKSAIMIVVISFFLMPSIADEIKACWMGNPPRACLDLCSTVRLELLFLTMPVSLLGLWAPPMRRMFSIVIRGAVTTPRVQSCDFLNVFCSFLLITSNPSWKPFLLPRTLIGSKFKRNSWTSNIRSSAQNWPRIIVLCFARLSK